MQAISNSRFVFQAQAMAAAQPLTQPKAHPDAPRATQSESLKEPRDRSRFASMAKPRGLQMNGHGTGERIGPIVGGHDIIGPEPPLGPVPPEPLAPGLRGSSGFGSIPQP